METYELEIEVLAAHLDDLDHVNNVQYVQWMQDVAKAHWNSVVPEDLRKDMVWVVRNHNITYKKAAVLGQTVRVRTYIAENRGYLSKRVVQMYLKSNDALLIDAVTEWCLLDATTLRPKKVPETVSSLFKV
jgi:acyl-CoA thioester hydrolase